MSQKNNLTEDASEFLGFKIDQIILKDRPLEEHENFDSFSVIQFVLYVENKYKIRFTKEQIENMNCFNDLEQALKLQLQSI